MAPINGDAAVVAATQSAAPAPAPPTAQKKQAARRQSSTPRRISMQGLQRAMSDLALELSRDSKTKAADAAAKQPQQLPAISEKQQQQQQAAEEELARCECCSMQEECTREYVRRVRDRYCGRWVCGLCAAAVSAEAERAPAGGGPRTTTEDALAAHMAVCGRFNRVGRANPVLMQTEAMREILRKRCRSNSPREHGGAHLARSSSCIPAITKELTR